MVKLKRGINHKEIVATAKRGKGREKWGRRTTFVPVVALAVRDDFTGRRWSGPGAPVGPRRVAGRAHEHRQ